jgi:hypothetical protein
VFRSRSSIRIASTTTIPSAFTSSIVCTTSIAKFSPAIASVQVRKYYLWRLSTNLIWLHPPFLSIPVPHLKHRLQRFLSSMLTTLRISASSGQGLPTCAAPLHSLHVTSEQCRHRPFFSSQNSDKIQRPQLGFEQYVLSLHSHYSFFSS